VGKREGNSKSVSRDNRKRPRKISAKTRNEGTRSRSSRSSTKSYLLPAAAICVLVVVVLGGLIYWGQGSKSAYRGKKHSSTPVSSKTEPEHKRESPKPKDAPEAQRREWAPFPQDQGKNSESAPREPGSIANGVSAHSSSVESRKAELPESDHAEERTKLAMNSPAIQPEKTPPVVKHPIPKPKVAKIAIVIDDFGQDLEMDRKFFDIPIPLTFSILPLLSHTKEISKLARSRGHEVMLHMPMEPQGYPKVKPGPGVLLLSMSSSQIEKTLRGVLDDSPGISGINNHMGSRFTEDKEAMATVLKELHRRGLYFIDSYTTSHSVGYSLARNLQVPTLRRDIFLDDNPSDDSIKSQIDQLVRKAKIQGLAVAIGHPREATFRVLSEEAARFEKEGIDVVRVSELIRDAPQIDLDSGNGD